jgi:C1A family cysteine protease
MFKRPIAFFLTIHLAFGLFLAPLGTVYANAETQPGAEPQQATPGAIATVLSIPQDAPLANEYTGQQGPRRAVSAQSKSVAGVFEYPLGEQPLQIDLSHLDNLSFPGVSPEMARGVADSSFDLRTQGKLPLVRNQGIWGTCWTFAACAGMESALLPGNRLDFSENNMANQHGFDYGYDDGGQYLMAAAYLTRWSGPVKETDDPYLGPGTSPAKTTPARHVQNIYILGNDLSDGAAFDPQLVADIKAALVDVGAVQCSFYWNAAYYDPGTFSYRNPTNDSTNHAVAVVGWDDSFPAASFLDPAPGDGAFILRNSWGDAWGDGGYFYVSYYDRSFGRVVSYPAPEPRSNYHQSYQYDPLGWVNSVGNGTESWYIANVFKASAKQKLEAVGFYTTARDTQYEIIVYTGVAESPANGTLAYSGHSGVADYSGFHTIKLDRDVWLNRGESFSVILRLQTPGYNFPAAYEYRLPGYSSAAAANPGQSFYSDDGISWADLTDWRATANFCIKAFAGAPITSSSKKPPKVSVTEDSPTLLVEPLETTSESFQAPEVNIPEIFLTVGERDYQILSQPDRELNSLDAPPLIVGGRIAVPARFFARAFGAKISWDARLKKAALLWGENEFLFTVGDRLFSFNGQPQYFLTPPFIIGGSLYVPLAQIARLSGVSVTWDSAGRRVKLQ